ncbi:unnamed protein product, partial [Rotaria sp. Silwood2]
MFHDKIHSWNTGEDFHLCANARKYANIRSFVMPILSSNKGDTTGRVAGTASSRKYIKDQLWLRGDRLMHSYQISKPSLLIYAETQNDAMFLIKYTKQSMTQLNGLIHFTTSNLITTNLETNEIKKLVASFHDM